jgi:peptidoglycan/LPS O-acetylase OafA/YrhL
MKRLSQLDGIRGLAVVLVILAHITPFLGLGLSRSTTLIVLSRLLGAGWMGVDIFFVLSGF